MTLVIAHRGASRAEPENTVSAFRRAGEMGADGVELDVRRTADDRLVVHHDAALADGRVIRETLSAQLPGHVASLDEALDACAGMFVNIEVKNDPDDPDHDPADWVVHRLAGLLSGRPPSGRWLISSFRLRTIEVCRRILPDVRTAWLVTEPTAETLTRVTDGGHTAIHPHVGRVSAASIAAAHAVGVAVNVWTCNDEDRMRELIGWGVDGICTDVPDVAVRVRSGG